MFEARDEQKTEDKFIRAVLKALGWVYDPQPRHKRRKAKVRPDYALASGGLRNRARSHEPKTYYPTHKQSPGRVGDVQNDTVKDDPLDARRHSPTRPIPRRGLLPRMGSLLGHTVTGKPMSVLTPRRLPLQQLFEVDSKHCYSQTVPSPVILWILRSGRSRLPQPRASDGWTLPERVIEQLEPSVTTSRPHLRPGSSWRKALRPPPV